MEIFSDSTRNPENLSRIFLRYKEFSPLQFYCSVGGYMAIPSIDLSNSVPDTHVGGLFRVSQSSPTFAAYLSLHIIDTHGATVSTCISAPLMKVYRDPCSCSYPAQPFFKRR